MSNGNGHRWSKFYWTDWTSDKALQSCSLAARGLWIELLAIAHASERVGYVLVNGKPPDIEQLADMLGRTTPREIRKLLDELERRGVFSVDENGVLLSRRMVRDATASEEGRKHIYKRWQGHNGPGPNSPPNSPPNSNPISPPITKNLEAESESDPPVRPPQGGPRTDVVVHSFPTARRRGGIEPPIRNGFLATIIADREKAQ